MYITRSLLGPRQFHQFCSFLQDGMEMKKMQVSVQRSKDTLLIWMQICSGRTLTCLKHIPVSQFHRCDMYLLPVYI